MRWGNRNGPDLSPLPFLKAETTQMETGKCLSGVGRLGFRKYLVPDIFYGLATAGRSLPGGARGGQRYLRSGGVPGGNTLPSMGLGKQGQTRDLKWIFFPRNIFLWCVDISRSNRLWHQMRCVWMFFLWDVYECLLVTVSAAKVSRMTTLMRFLNSIFFLYTLQDTTFDDGSSNFILLNKLDK